MNYLKQHILVSLILLLFTNVLFGSTVSLSAIGFPITVLDESGEPLIGVTISTEDGEYGVVTDLDGKAEVEGVAHSATLIFQYVGYATKRIPFYELRKSGGQVVMNEESKILAEVVVWGRRDDKKEDIPYAVANISKDDIALLNPQTSADLLAASGEIFVQKSQMGGGSPVIRGFEANRVLLVLDGVRMNNAIYRDGHLQNAVTVDGSILERVELIYGPGSLMYGSDALGGVVHYRTRDPKIYFGNSELGYQMKTNLFTRYASANAEKTFHVDLEYGKDKWGSLTSITATDYNDLRAGSKRPEGYEDFGKRYFYSDRIDGIDQAIENSYFAVNRFGGKDTVLVQNQDLQVGTAYSQIDVLQKIKYQKDEHFYLVGNLQFSTSSDVPRYDNLTDTVASSRELKWSDWYYGPQTRFLSSLKGQSTKRTKLWDRAIGIASFQLINEDRYNRKFGSSREKFQLETVYVVSGTVDFDKSFGNRGQHTVNYGGDLNNNQVFSAAGKRRVSDIRDITSTLTRYPSGGSRLSSGGAYLNYTTKNRDSTLVFNAGLRYSLTDMYVRYRESDEITWPDHYYTGISNRSSALTWASGVTYNSKNGWQMRGLVAKAFRAPNVDDLAKIRAKGDFITIPNPDLKPEQAITGEVTLAKTFGDPRMSGSTHGKLSATVFQTSLTDAIVRRIVPDAACITDGADCFTPIRNENSSNAKVNGYSTNAELTFKEKFKIKATYSFTKGVSRFRDTISGIAIDTLVPMSHIPPAYGRISAGYFGDKIKVDFSMRFNAAKTIDQYAITDFSVSDGVLVPELFASSDNLDEGWTRYEVSPEGNRSVVYVGTLGWATFNIHSSFQLTKAWSIDLAVENIFDVHYRTFSSGVSAPGRNLIVTARGNF